MENLQKILSDAYWTRLKEIFGQNNDDRESLSYEMFNKISFTRKETLIRWLNSIEHLHVHLRKIDLYDKVYQKLLSPEHLSKCIKAEIIKNPYGISLKTVPFGEDLSHTLTFSTPNNFDRVLFRKHIEILIGKILEK